MTVAVGRSRDSDACLMVGGNASSVPQTGPDRMQSGLGSYRMLIVTVLDFLPSTTSTTLTSPLPAKRGGTRRFT